MAVRGGSVPLASKSASTGPRIGARVDEIAVVDMAITSRDHSCKPYALRPDAHAARCNAIPYKPVKKVLLFDAVTLR